MNAIRRILVPVDFSTPSRAALDYAAEIATKLGATVDVIHVWQLPGFVPLGSGMSGAGVGELAMTDMIRQSAEEALAGFVDEARKRNVVVGSARTLAGAPTHAIVDAARAGNYDLIVVGTHGRTGLPRVLLGSVAENVVRHAHCPVLAVRPQSVTSRGRDG
jgi:nucleotide-binding universal stress UspA family protein